MGLWALLLCISRNEIAVKGKGYFRRSRRSSERLRVLQPHLGCSLTERGERKREWSRICRVGYLKRLLSKCVFIHRRLWYLTNVTYFSLMLPLLSPVCLLDSAHSFLVHCGSQRRAEAGQCKVIRQIWGAACNLGGA